MFSQCCLCGLELSCGSSELGSGCYMVRVLTLFCGSSQRVHEQACATDVGGKANAAERRKMTTWALSSLEQRE